MTARTMSCEACDRQGEYLCNGCNLFLCTDHYRSHECDRSRLTVETDDSVLDETIIDG